MINTCFVLPLQVARRLNDKQFYSTLYEAEFVNFSESSNEISVARYSEVKAGDGSQASKACKNFYQNAPFPGKFFSNFHRRGSQIAPSLWKDWLVCPLPFFHGQSPRMVNAISTLYV